MIAALKRTPMKIDVRMVKPKSIVEFFAMTLLILSLKAL